jgi:hypothetical protein
MANERPLPAFSEVYERVWRACLSQWPLLAVQFVFSALQFGAFLACLAILFGPLMVKYGDLLLQNPQAIDKNQFLSDCLEKFSDPVWVGLLVGMVFFYLTWWLLLSAVVEGGIFRIFWRHWQNKESFSLPVFFKEGLKFFSPMIWLQFYLSLYAFGLFLVFLGMGLFLTGFLALFHFNVVLSLLACFFLGLPLLVLGVAACLLLGVYAFAAKARLTLGDAPRTALAHAYQDCKADRYRILKAGMLVFGIFFMTYIAVRLVFGILTFIPLAGLLFALVRNVLSTFLALLLQTGLSALSVRFIAEREGQT